MKKGDNTYQKMSFAMGGGKLFSNSSLRKAALIFNLDRELCLYLHLKNSLLLHKLGSVCCLPYYCISVGLSFLEPLQISFKLCLPSCDSQDQPLHYTTSGHVKE